MHSHANVYVKLLGVPYSSHKASGSLAYKNVVIVAGGDVPDTCSTSNVMHTFILKLIYGYSAGKQKHISFSEIIFRSSGVRSNYFSVYYGFTHCNNCAWSLLNLYVFILL